MNIKKIKLKKIDLILVFYIIATIFFAVPSIIYYIQHKTILKFDFEFKFLLTDSISRIDQTIIYIAILTTITIIYLAILKKRKEIFNNTKKCLSLLEL